MYCMRYRRYGMIIRFCEQSSGKMQLESIPPTFWFSQNRVGNIPVGYSHLLIKDIS
jgi:hypothetical protein